VQGTTCLEKGDLKSAVTSFGSNMNTRPDCQLLHRLAVLDGLLRMAGEVVQPDQGLQFHQTGQRWLGRFRPYFCGEKAGYSDLAGGAKISYELVTTRTSGRESSHWLIWLTPITVMEPSDLNIRRRMSSRASTHQLFHAIMRTDR
jgi:hypothetical protein